MTRSNFWRRFTKILLIILIFLIALVAFFFIGTIVGYTLVGDGNVADIFTQQFWQTLFGFFTA